MRTIPSRTRNSCEAGQQHRGRARAWQPAILQPCTRCARGGADEVGWVAATGEGGGVCSLRTTLSKSLTPRSFVPHYQLAQDFEPTALEQPSKRQTLGPKRACVREAKRHWLTNVHSRALHLCITVLTNTVVVHFKTGTCPRHSHHYRWCSAGMISCASRNLR